VHGGIDGLGLALRKHSPEFDPLFGQLFTQFVELLVV